MAAKEFCNELRELVSCQICFEEFGDEIVPRTLYCLHIFCEDCIRHQVTNNSITCPLCQVNTAIPGGIVSNLPAFFYSRNLRDVVKRLEARHAICQICESEVHKSDVCSYCFRCSCGFCEDCRDRHNRVHANHPQIPVTARTVDYILCPEHDIHFDNFCITCSKAVCTRCYMQDHINHRVYDLTYDRSEARKDLRDFLLSELKRADEALNKVDKLQSGVDTEWRKLRKQMKTHRDALLKELNDKYSMLCSEVDAKKDNLVRSIKESKKEIEEARCTIERLIEETRFWEEPVHSLPQAGITNIDELATEVKDQMPRLSSDELLVPEMMFLPGPSNLVSCYICEKREETFRVIMPCPDESSVVPKVDRAKTVDSGSNKIRTYHGKNVLDIEYLEDGQLAIIEGAHGMSIHNMDTNASDSVLSALCCIQYRWLRGVAVDKVTHRIAVTLSTGKGNSGFLLLCTNQGNHWRHEEYKICKTPQYVAITKDGDYFISSHTLVHKYDKRINLVWSMDLRETIHDMCLDNNDRLLVCTTKNVYVYDQQSRLMTLDTASGRLVPRGISVAEDDSILVSDQRTKSILLFSATGRLTKTLLTTNYMPYKIALDKNKHVAVSDWQENCVYVYKQ